MSHAEFISPSPFPDTQDRPVVVIGGGPVGMRVAQELIRHGRAVTVLSAEPHKPYNRVRLTPLLGGDVQFGDIELPDLSDPAGRATCLTGKYVVEIDRDEHIVRTADGSLYPYAQLILATGSQAFVPGIPGRDLPGVYTFRTAEDTSALLARSISARRVAVIGGGLLGLEAARGMRRRGAQVSVIEHETHPMPRQLDAEAGALLSAKIADLGVDIRSSTAVREIFGEHKVEALRLSDGSEIACDTVIICTGVRANTQLAQKAGLPFHNGILVNDRLQTRDPDIYAVGECIEHDGRLYGLVGPGFAQADVAAAVIAGEDASFTGAAPATKLKVIGAEVFSAGEVEQLDQQIGVVSHIWRDDGQYRRIFVHRGRLVGAIAIGGWPQASRVQDAVQDHRVVYPWMIHRFRRTGLLWIDEDIAPADMPDTAILCNCTGVTAGQLRAARGKGADSIPDLSMETGAGSVCGTCQPLLEDFLDGDAPPKPVALWKPLLGFSGIALLAAALPLLVGNVPLPESFGADSLRQWLWRDNIVKQWSGFILLGITATALLIGLRKRFRWTDRLGGYDGWRLVHIGIGLLAVAGLYAHTGFSLGYNLNFALGAFFAATLVLGAIAGLATGGDHELRARHIGTSRKPPRRLPTWLHILAVWPVPVLILVHVLTSYAF